MGLALPETGHKRQSADWHIRAGHMVVYGTAGLGQGPGLDPLGRVDRVLVDCNPRNS